MRGPRLPIPRGFNYPYYHKKITNIERKVIKLTCLCIWRHGGSLCLGGLTSHLTAVHHATLWPDGGWNIWISNGKTVPFSLWEFRMCSKWITLNSTSQPLEKKSCEIHYKCSIYVSLYYVQCQLSWRRS